MKDYTICFIGSEDTFKLLGNKATESDLDFRHYVKGERVLTFIKPIGYPDKIKTLIQALNLSDYLIIELEVIDKYLAELIILAQLTKKEGLFIVSQSKGHLINELSSITKGTITAGYDSLIIKDNSDLSKLKDSLINKEAKTTSETIVVIDHAFNVKNVGLVALGFLIGGELNARDQVLLIPGNKTIQVKTIQCMDKDYKSIKAKARVGLALKNCQLEDVNRGYLLVKKPVNETQLIKGKLSKINYYKGGLKEGMQLTIINGLLVVQGVIKNLSNEELVIELQKPLVKIKEETILIDTNASGLRVIGLIDYSSINN